MMNPKILIIEDEARMRRLLELVLQEPGYEVQSAADGEEGILLWKDWLPDVVLSDMKMPKMGGLDVLRYRNTNFPNTPFILLTAFGTVSTAVSAMKEGAFDYLTKPVDNNHVLELVARALETCVVRTTENSRIIGASSVMKKLNLDIATVARIDSSVLITGESGTGKELTAKAIHDAYTGKGAPYVRVNCPAIPRDLLESELFGHRRGAFTGAIEDRKGAFTAADGGTLFLDEIGDLPLSLQPKLLHAVEHKQVTPVGGTDAQTVKVKIISATNRDLEAMVDAGAFRRDLYYRLNALQLQLPPLRERSEDIEELAHYFMQAFSHQYGNTPLRLENTALARLQAYEWPGNIRELRNIIERGCLQCRGDVFTADLLPADVAGDNTIVIDHSSQENSLDLFGREKELIFQALKECHWNQSRAALQLGITRNTLRYRIKKYGIKNILIE